MDSCDCNLMSWCTCQLQGFREFISQQVDLRSTSNIKGVFILCRQHKDNKLLPIYKNIKCLASYHAKPKRICLMPWGWPSSIIQFLYIKPQRGGAPHTHPRVVLYRFSTSNHNCRTCGWSTASVVLYHFSTSNHNDRWLTMKHIRVVLYRFSTSNHNEYEEVDIVY